jgi:tripartite-type tricarboxylate transporter receptor subunit TctC
MTHPTNPQRRQLAVAFAGGAALSALGWPARAATDFPSGGKPVRIIVPWPAGGGGDVLVRLIAPVMSEKLGTPVIVENRAGATGTIGSGVAAKSPADGYTLVYGSADSHSIMPQLLKGISYDARKDFTAVAPICLLPYAIAVHPSVPAKDVKELVAWIKAASVKPTYGSWGVGSSGQVVMESFKAATGTDLLHVPYQGTAPVLVALLGNQVPVAILPMPLVEQQAKANALRVIAVTTPERLPSMPSLPTLKEQGVAVDVGVWIGFLAPAATPPDIVAKLAAAIDAAVASPAVHDKMVQLHTLPDRQSPAAYQAYIEREYERWGKVITQAKITLDA